MSKNPLVSVGIPTYNRPEGLRRTLECITNQTYKNLEIIVSDNCSPTAETETVVNEFIKKDRRIKFFRQEENKGPYLNYKFVLERSRGEFFMLAADDDEWDLEFIECCLNYHKIKEYGCVFTKYIAKSDVDFRKFSMNHNRYMKYKYGFIISIFLDEVLTYKGNIIYGLWRKEILQKIYNYCLEKNINFAGRGFDGAFVAYALRKTKMYQVDRTLFYKNYKRYIPGSYKSIITNNVKKIYKFFRNPVSFVKDLIVAPMGTYRTYANLFPEKEYRFILLPIKTLLVYLRYIFL